MLINFHKTNENEIREYLEFKEYNDADDIMLSLFYHIYFYDENDPDEKYQYNFYTFMEFIYANPHLEFYLQYMEDCTFAEQLVFYLCFRMHPEYLNKPS